MAKDRHKNFKDYENEGVFYEPTDYNNEKPIQPIEQVKKRAKPIGSKKQKPQRQHQKSQFPVFYGITIAISIIAGVAIFAIVFNGFLFKGTKNPNPVPSPEPSATIPVESNKGDMLKSTAIIRNISRNRLILTDLDTMKQFELESTGSTELKDKYGEYLTFGELKVGDMIDIEYEAQTGLIESLVISSKATEYKNVEGIQIDDIYKTLTAKNTVFSYDENTVVTYKGIPYEIKNITHIDQVDLRGYANKLWVVDVKRGHGKINIINKDKISEGLLEIGNTKFLLLSETDSVDMEEGTHRIVVKGKNIQPYITELTIENLQEVDLDLAEADIKKGELFIKCNIDDYVLSIDGKKQEPINPIELEQGEYIVKVEAKNYSTWQEKVVIGEGRKEIEVELKKEVNLSKLSLKTEPSGAEIYINNERIGISPLEVDIEYGRHNIVAKSSGYNDFPLTVTIEEKQHSYLIMMIPTTQPSTPVLPTATNNPTDDTLFID